MILALRHNIALNGALSLWVIIARARRNCGDGDGTDIAIIFRKVRGIYDEAIASNRLYKS